MSTANRFPEDVTNAVLYRSLGGRSFSSDN